MSFALPTAFWLAACAVPIIVFYILKVRLRRQPVSTNLFWKQIYDEKPPRSIWQHLRHLLSLLVQLFVLSLLVLAIADPYLPWELLQARRIVVVVDRSASMRAADIKPTRFDAALNSAGAIVDGLRFRDEMAIIAAGPQPEVVIGMSSHAPTLKRALHDINVSDNPTNLEAAIELGKELVGGHPHGEVLVFTDGCVDGDIASSKKSTVGESAALPNAESKLADGEKQEPIVNHAIFGTRASNVGITQLQVRRSLVDPLGYEVLVAVANASDKDVECRLELELDDVPVDVIPLKLKSDEKWRRSLQKTSIDGGKLVAKLTQIGFPKAGARDVKDTKDAGQGEVEKPAQPEELPNALAVDDTAWTMLAARKPQKVLLVTEGNLFMQKVFQANSLVQCEVVKAMPKEWPADTIVVLHRQVPPELPQGNLLVVEPAAGCDAWDVGDTMENPIITQQKTESPLMAHVRLDNMLMPAAKKITFKSSPEILAGTVAGDPIYASIQRDKGKCLVLSVDLDQSDLAFRTAFPIMVTNALAWFRGNTGEMQGSLATGQLASVPMADSKERTSNNSQLVLRSPSGRETKVARPDIVEEQKPADATNTQALQSPDSEKPQVASATQAANLSLGPLDECGVWTLVERQSPEKETVATEIAVNLSNERETDLRPREEFTVKDVSVTLTSGWFARPMWFYIVAAAFAVTVVEWLLHQRRVIT